MNAYARFPRIGKSLLMLLLLGLSALAVAKSVEDDRAKVRKSSQEVLARLYTAQPAAKDTIANAKGYATFSKWGLTLGALGGGIGKGLAVQQPGGKETFMRYVEGSAGLGFGIKKYDLVFVFETEKAYKAFVDKGWQASTNATFAAKTSQTSGKAYSGAAAISEGVWVYLNTEKGLAAEIGLKGTKYYKDKALN
ncbi:MAG TPA: YSC84-related protein [Thermomonas sp.]|nr:YSC84-related protein [Thermomonas sp.]